MMSDGAKRGGFTLLEVLIVTSIIGMLALIGQPLYSRAHERSLANICRNSLRQMESAKQIAAMEYGWENDDGPGTLGMEYFRSTCAEFIKGGEVLACPTGAMLAFNAVDEIATCSCGLDSHKIHAED